MFSTTRLQALHAVAAHGSIARAARVLHLTPSAVSQQLAVLEREAGTALTEPAGRGITMTPAGRVLADHAEVILSRITLARRDLDRLDDEVVGPLRIGAITTSVHALAPGALARLRSRYPDLHVRLDEGEPEEILPGLAAGDFDLAVVDNLEGSPAPTAANTSRSQLCADVLDLALPAEHPLAAGRDTVSLVELADTDLQWVAETASSWAYDWLVGRLRRAGVEPRVMVRVRGFAMHLELVAGTGLAAVLPRLARPAVPDSVRILATDPLLLRSIDAVWRSDRESPAVRAATAAFQAAAQAYDLVPEV